MVAAASATSAFFAVAYYRRLYPKLVRARQLHRLGVPSASPSWPKPTAMKWRSNNHRTGPDSGSSTRHGRAGPAFFDSSPSSHRRYKLFLRRNSARSPPALNASTGAVEDSATVLIQYSQASHAAVDVRWNSHTARPVSRHRNRR